MRMRSPSVRLIRRTVKLKDGSAEYWELRWPGKSGRPRSEIIGRCDDMTERDAGRKRRDKIADLENGKAIRDPSGLTLQRFLEADREAIRAGVEPATIKAHEVASQHAIDAIGADARLDGIGWEGVAAITKRLSEEHEINGLTKPACRPATINKNIATLKAAWNRAIRRGLLVGNPFADERLADVQPGQKRIFTAAEVDLMIQVAGGIWWQTFIRLAFTTGLRFGELVNLMWDDIDEEAGTVTVSAKRPGTFTVGDQSYPILPWSAKSHHERTVPLAPSVAKLLKRMRMRAGGSRYVFLPLRRLRTLEKKRKAGRLPQPAHWINNALRDFHAIQARAAAQLAEQIGKPAEWRIGTLHDLRKSYGTLMARSVSMHELKTLMGHSSITVTEKFYLGPSLDLAERVRAVLADVC